MKPVDVESNKYIDSIEHINDEDPKFKLVVLLEYQNIKTFLQKAMSQIGLKKFFWLKKVKNTASYMDIISDLKDKEILEKFYKKELKKKKKKNQKEFR